MFSVNELCFSVLYAVLRVCVIYIYILLLHCMMYKTNEICNIVYFAYNIYIYTVIRALRAIRTQTLKTLTGTLLPIFVTAIIIFYII